MSASPPSVGNIDKIGRSVADIMEKIASGAHSAPEAGAAGIATVPSRHRLYNAAGGIGLWIVGRKIMDVLVGETPQGKKIDKEKLDPTIRPLHGILAYNRYADDPHNQWMRVVDDLTPAIIGSVGAVLGSQYFFAAKEAGIRSAVKWGTKHTNIEKMLADNTIPILAKDNFMALQQAKTWRVLSGIAGVFAASSGMALLVAPVNILNYGTSLNNAFALANGVVPGGFLFKNKALGWIFNTTSKTTHGPALAAKAIATNVSNCVAEMASLEAITAEGVTAQNAGRVEVFCDAIIHKLFPKVTEKGAKRFQKEVMDTIAKAVRDPHGNKPEEVAKHVKDALENLLVKEHALDKTIAKLSGEIGKENFGAVSFANNGFAGLAGNHPEAAYTAAAAALFSFDAMGEAAKKESQHGAKHEIAGKTREDIGEVNRPAPISAQQAQEDVANNPGFVNGPLLNASRWLSDSVLNVPPQNRLFSAIGLTSGLWVGYRGMRALAGKEFNGAPLAKDAKMDPVIKWGAEKLRANGLHFDFKYFIDNPGNRLKRGVFWLVPTATAMVGTYLGSKYAFRDYYKKLEHPEYLEDYTAKIAMAQGDKWGWLLSSAAVMASASGLSNLPIPGLNYSIGLSTRSVLSYDKKVTMPGMKWWSGNKSDYYFGTRGALNYTIEYAVRNPSEYPKELAALAKATLEPVFPDVTPDQVAAYVNKIQAIRNKYWEEGAGIPKDLQDDARKELRGILRGAGFEKTLGELGLDPAKAVFNNGAAGKIADAIGAKKQVLKLEEEYRHKYTQRKASYSEASPALQAAAPVDTPDTTLAKDDNAMAPAAPQAPSFAANSSVGLGATTRNISTNILADAQKQGGNWRDSTLRQKETPKVTAIS